jgi:hypothetical protein
MKAPKRATIYFDADVHRALRRRATQSEQSISQVVNEAVRLALAQDAVDSESFDERSAEKNLDFTHVVDSLKRRGVL